MLKVNELRNLSPEELREKETGLRKELMQLRFQAKTGKLERQSAVKETRRSIARVLTVLNESKQEEAGIQAAPAKKVKTAEAAKPKAEVKKSAVKKHELKAGKAAKTGAASSSERAATKELRQKKGKS